VTDVLPVRRALISVADKAELAALGRRLVERGVAIVSSGSTAVKLHEEGVPVTPVSEVTGFPEMLEGRVKTLHPRIHAGILADKGKPDHIATLQEHGIEPFDLVVVNLYPFRETVASGAPAPEVIEQIDIGGPALIRASAKNFESVAVITSPEGYDRLIRELDDLGGVSRDTRLELAREAFRHTASYDRAIASWFGAQEEVEEDEGLPKSLSLELVRRASLRYGENPHQRGAIYVREGGLGPLGGADVLQGKEMSFNNWLDAEAARALAGLFVGAPAAVIVKHHNPCGVAMGSSASQAYERALAGDPVSAFGGIVAFNTEADEAAARAMSGVFTEVVVAPSYSDGALEVFAQKGNLRVVRASLPEPGGLEVRPIDGGALVQDMDSIVEIRSDMKVVSSREPTEAQWRDLLFGWTVAARVKSNAIVLVKDLATVAIGAGQMNRLTSVEIAAREAGVLAGGACLASDAFFPFRDGIDRAAEAGVAAVIQPGGSIRDEEVVEAAEKHGMAMVLTGRRHFRH